VLSHLYGDPDFLAREAQELEGWIDSLDTRPGGSFPQGV
jgi:hypothetical protein